MNILITICARGGSKGIPGKNIKLLNDKPLLYYTLECAKNFARHYQADIVLSTESSDILACAASWGYKAEYERPSYLAGDSAGKIDTIRHAWKFAMGNFKKSYDFVLDLDVTSPLRTFEDLKSALDLIVKNKKALNLFSVSPSGRNPYFNMVEEGSNGFFQLVKPSHKLKSRQQAPLVYDMNASFYFFTKEFMEEDYDISITDRSIVYLVPHVCFDLDELQDFQLMELMMVNGLIDFDLC